MNPSKCTISDNIYELREIFFNEDWRHNKIALTMLRTAIVNLLVLDELLFSDAENKLIEMVFVRVSNNEMETL